VGLWAYSDLSGLVYCGQMKNASATSSAIFVCFAAMIVFAVGGLVGSLTVNTRPAWDAEYSYGLKMYHQADPDIDVMHLRWSKEQK